MDQISADRPQPSFGSRLVRRADYDALVSELNDVLTALDSRLTVAERALAGVIDDLDADATTAEENAQIEALLEESSEEEAARRPSDDMPDEERFEPEYDETPEEEAARLRREAIESIEQGNEIG